LGREGRKNATSGLARQHALLEKTEIDDASSAEDLRFCFKSETIHKTRREKGEGTDGPRNGLTGGRVKTYHGVGKGLRVLQAQSKERGKREEPSMIPLTESIE